MEVVFLAWAFDQGIIVREDPIVPMRTTGDDRVRKGNGVLGLG